MERMANAPETQRWWAVCMPCQRPLSSRKSGEHWAEMENCSIARDPWAMAPAGRATDGAPVAGVRWRAVPAPCPELTPLASEIDPELAQLAVQVGALQAGLLGDAGHGAPFALEVKLEIGFLEIVAGLTQRTVQVKVLV